MVCGGRMFECFFTLEETKNNIAPVVSHKHLMNMNEAKQRMKTTLESIELRETEMIDPEL